jgi:NADH-quinone oxidoreductase subunit H
MRAAAQIVSYEVPTGLSVLTILLVAGSLNMHDIAMGQASGLFGIPTESGHGVFSWNVFLYPPFGLIAFLVFYTAILAETNRTPFDIPEAESELVAGFHTEYSGMRFSFFFLAEYANMLAMCAVATTLFLGAYLPPFANMESAGLSLLLGLICGGIGYKMKGHIMYGLFGFLVGGGLGTTAGVFFPDRILYASEALGPVAVFGEGLFWFFAKTFALLFVMMWLRWTLPRYRVDQLMDLCWKKLTPLAFMNFFVIGAATLFTPELKKVVMGWLGMDS